MTIYLVLEEINCCLTCVGIFDNFNRAFRAIETLTLNNDPNYRFNMFELTDQHARSIAALATKVRTEDHPITYTNHAELGVTR